MGQSLVLGPSLTTTGMLSNYVFTRKEKNLVTPLLCLPQVTQYIEQGMSLSFRV